MKKAILEIKNISKHFGGTQALKNVSFDVKKGEIHALVGANGSGKSTLIKSLMGVVKIDGGHFVYKNEAIKITDPIHAREIGIGAIYQEPTLIPYFNAIENIFLGHEICKNKLGHLDRVKLEESAKVILDNFGLDFPLIEPVLRLGLGQQRIIEVAKVLSLNSELILIDEATAGMHKEEIDKFFHILKKLKEKGITIIYVSHYLEDIFVIADRVSILRDGEYIGTDKISEISVIDIIPKILGHALAENLFPEKENNRGKCVFKVKNLHHGTLLRDINFEIYEGEILGITGLMGAGKTELARTLYGVDSYKSGGNLFSEKGEKLDLARCKINKKNGIVYLPEERKSQSIFPNTSLKENISIGNIILLAGKVFGKINKKKMENFALGVIKHMNVRADRLGQGIDQLSGGNQQKLVLGKWIASEPRILLLDEPTRGIDIGAKAEIYVKIRSIVKDNKAVIIFSSEVDELVGLCDRVIVLHKGRLFKELKKNEITKHNILLYSMGREYE